MTSTLGIRIHSRHLGEYIVPTAAEHEAELAKHGVYVIPFAAVEVFERVAKHFAGAQVVILRVCAKGKSTR